MSVLDLEHFLPYRLSVLSNRVSRGIAETYEARFGLSVTEWRVIAIIGRYPGVSATEVSQRAAMDKVSISRAVRRLLEFGRIEREPNDADRRERHLRLTAAGQSIYDDIVPAALAYERRIRDALTPEENETLERLIDRLGEVV